MVHYIVTCFQNQMTNSNDDGHIISKVCLTAKVLTVHGTCTSETVLHPIILIASVFGRFNYILSSIQFLIIF